MWAQSYNSMETSDFSSSRILTKDSILQVNLVHQTDLSSIICKMETRLPTFPGC